MMRLATAWFASALLLVAGPVHAQQLVPTTGLASNQVQTLDAAGDSLWSGPLLTVYLEPDDRPRSGDSLLTADEPLLTEQDNVVFSIEAENVSSTRSLVWAGLAFRSGEEAAAGGFLVSADGGNTFTARPPQLDAADDTTVAFGASTLPAIPVTQGGRSAPLDLAFEAGGETVWLAGNRSGLRRSTDRGETWSRAVLPPDTLQLVDPEAPNDFLVGPPQTGGRGSQNHVALSVLIDETGTVWAGTPAGVNRSTPSDRRPEGARAWRRFEAGPSPGRMTGNTVVALAEQPRADGRNPIWMATWPGTSPPEGQRFGLTVTGDGGETFRKALVGERISDLAAREERVYATSDRALFVSRDQGRTWRTVTTFPVQGDDHVLPPDVSPRAVTTTPSALWVGTTEGLLRLGRAQEARLLSDAPTAEPPRWRLLRTNVPVNPEPEQVSEQVPDVETYAYPNPFVPARDQLVRIVYEMEAPGPVRVDIYDFAMNRVRTLREDKGTGQQETAWDGTDDRGLRVPTGTYLYTVDHGTGTVRGKIVVAN